MKQFDYDRYDRNDDDDYEYDYDSYGRRHRRRRPHYQYPFFPFTHSSQSTHHTIAIHTTANHITVLMAINI